MCTSQQWYLTENTARWTNAGLKLVHRLRRWTNIKPALVQRIVFAGIVSDTTHI